MSHHIYRTSKLGEDWRGTCVRCGVQGLRAGDVFDPICEGLPVLDQKRHREAAEKRLREERQGSG